MGASHAESDAIDREKGSARADACRLEPQDDDEKGGRQDDLPRGQEHHGATHDGHQDRQDQVLATVAT